jgi:hypothetical protein
MGEFTILRRQGGISKNFNLRLAGFGLGIVYPDHIESPLARRWKAPQILAHHRRDLASLMLVNRRFPWLHIARRPRLNFHEAKNIVFPSDQINLSAAARRPEVARYHRVSQFPEMKISRLLSTPHSQMMRGNLLCGKSTLGQPVKESKEGMCRSTREHTSGNCASTEHWDIPKLNVRASKSSRM